MFIKMIGQLKDLGCSHLYFLFQGHCRLRCFSHFAKNLEHGCAKMSQMMADIAASHFFLLFLGGTIQGGKNVPAIFHASNHIFFTLFINTFF